MQLFFFFIIFFLSLSFSFSKQLLSHSKDPSKFPGWQEPGLWRPMWVLEREFFPTSSKKNENKPIKNEIKPIKSRVFLRFNPDRSVSLVNNDKKIISNPNFSYVKYINAISNDQIDPIKNYYKVTSLHSWLLCAASFSSSILSKNLNSKVLNLLSSIERNFDIESNNLSILTLKKSFLNDGKFMTKEEDSIGNTMFVKFELNEKNKYRNPHSNQILTKLYSSSIFKSINSLKSYLLPSLSSQSQYDDCKELLNDQKLLYTTRCAWGELDPYVAHFQLGRILNQSTSKSKTVGHFILKSNLHRPLLAQDYLAIQ